MSPRFQPIGAQNPPDGWHYTVGDFKVSGDKLEVVAQNARAYHEANDLEPLADYEQAVIQQTAEALDQLVRIRFFRIHPDDLEAMAPTKPKGKGGRPKGAQKIDRVIPEAERLVEGAKLLVGIEKARLAGEFALVKTERALQRAAVCIGCPFNSQNGNQPVERSLMIKLGATRVRQIREEAQRKGKIPPLSLRKQGQLGICTICKCSLNDAIWFSPETHREFVEKHGGLLPDACWKKVEHGGAAGPKPEPPAEPEAKGTEENPFAE